MIGGGESGFPGGSGGDDPPASAGGIGDVGWAPGGGRATHSSILAWRLPWTEEIGGLQSMGRIELDMTAGT